MADPWDWQDDSFKLDAESPLEITRCLWNEISSSEEDSRSLFSTPLADISSQPPLYPVRGQGPEIISHRPCYSGDQDGSSRMKRRRLLFCEPEPAYDSCHAQDTDNVLETFSNCVGPLTQGCSSDVQQSLEVTDSLSDTFWYKPCDDVTAPFGATTDPGSQEWITNSLDVGESNDSGENIKVDFPVWPGGQSSGDDAVEGPGTPLPGRSTAHSQKGFETRKQLSPPSTPYPKFSAPVAYPFTLLKPSETEGDITLKDINQRILLPSLRPSPRLQAVEDSWLSSPTDSGLGLSGKSIVARTKIHTEGNGTITIMRTRG